MRHDFLDRYSRLESPIHRLSAAVKLIAALSFIILTVSLPFDHPWFFLVLFGILIATAAFSRIPWHFLIGRLFILEPFALGVAVMALFQHHGYVVFLNIVVRSTLCLFMMILASNTMPFSEILTVLQKIKVPDLLITVLALAYRYLFVFIDEGERLQRARRSRTFVATNTKHWVSLASLVGQLFIRSTERAERIFAAMTSRGWK